MHRTSPTRIDPESREPIPAPGVILVLVLAVLFSSIAAGRGHCGDEPYLAFRRQILEKAVSPGNGSMRQALEMCERSGLLRRIFDLTRQPPPAVPALESAEYFGLHEGARYRYVDSVTGEDFPMRVDGTVKIHGVQAWKIARPVKFLPRPDFVLMSADRSGVFMHQRQLAGTLLDFDPPVKLCDAKVTVGSSHETTPTEVNPGTKSRLTWVSRVEGVETVQVPAGAFECLKIRLLIRDPRTRTTYSDVDLYYGKGVGLVRRRGYLFGAFGTEELRSYEPGRASGRATGTR